MSLWHAENEYLKVTVQPDASVQIIDKINDVVWEMGPVALQEEGPIDVGHVWLRTERSICEQYAGRFRGESVGEHLRFTLLGCERREIGQFTCRIRLDRSWLEFNIFDIDEDLPSLVFPTPIVSESLVLPQGVGQWLREPIPGRRFWVYPAHLNMRWFGGLSGGHAWIAILDQGYADAGALATGMSISPGWLKSLGKWTSDVRIVRYGFLAGGYVELAKVYRAYAIENRLHRSLQEKMEKLPASRNLLGGRILSFMQANSRNGYTERFEDRLEAVPDPISSALPEVFVSHPDAARIIDEAQRLGMERGLVVMRGWINGGYDETHPDVWPPDPALGTIDELKQVLTKGNPFTVALHDNYQDIYQQTSSWPNGVIWLQSGDPMPGGYWAGGQAYILNSRDGLSYAQRNWEQIKTLDPRAMFIDTTIAVQFYESYESGNNLTRVQDEHYKIELLKFYREQELVLGSEEGADFGIPWVDWIETRHRRKVGTTIPLWPLVFHDAAFVGRYGSAGQPAYLPERWLTDMLWGYMLLWGFRETQTWQVYKEAFRSSLIVDRWHKQVGADEMVSHCYLTDDVEQTEFSSGVAIVVNFSDQPYHQPGGIEVPALDYLIRE